MQPFQNKNVRVFAITSVQIRSWS